MQSLGILCVLFLKLILGLNFFYYLGCNILKQCLLVLFSGLLYKKDDLCVQ